MWQSITTKNDTVKATKDCRFCREIDIDNLYINEVVDIEIATQWINDVPISSFKYQDVFAVSSMRLRGDVLYY